MKRIAYLTATLLLFAGALYSSSSLAFAGTSDNLSGWAWSSNIGWISFNCTDTNSCGTVDYGVNENADGTLTGYAWSSNIGWIQFGGLSGFPSGSGTQAKNAEINGNNAKGFARALSYATGGGGWDGWIALSGATLDNHSYGLTLSGTSLTGFAWGSNLLGWINFYVTDNIGPPPSFSITGPGSLQIQFLSNSTGADSVSGTYFVDNGGTSFSNPVTVSVTGISPALPSGVTATYSFNGGAFSANPTPVTISSPYSTGFSFETHLSASISTNTTYTISLTGTGAGAPNFVKSIVLVPVTSNPSFQER